MLPDIVLRGTPDVAHKNVQHQVFFRNQVDLALETLNSYRFGYGGFDFEN